MDYNSIAAGIINELNSIKSEISSLSNRNFDGYWTGPAHDNLTNRLNNTIKNLEIQLGLVNSYANALRNLDYYKSKGNEIANLDYKSNSSRVNNLQAERATLKQSITNVTSQIKPYQVQNTIINYNG